MPKITAVATVIPTAKAITCQSTEKSRTTSLTEFDRPASSARLAPAANRTPRRVPAVANVKFSMSTCRAICHRDAPRANLIANSGWRATARVIDRCAMFKQAISSTNPTTAIRMNNG